jgi:AcrR family transcriptional regulator
MAVGPRLEPNARRDHLIDVGTTAFAKSPYEDVRVEQIAELAGVSRGLLYHYFPTKKDFFREIVRRVYGEILERTTPDLSLPVDLRLESSLDAYLDYVERHPHAYRAVFRSAAGSDSAIQKIVQSNLDRQAERLLEGLDEPLEPRALVRIAARAWLAFLISAVLDWLDGGAQISREQLRDLCLDVLASTLQSAARVGGRNRETARRAGRFG